MIAGLFCDAGRACLIFHVLIGARSDERLHALEMPVLSCGVQRRPLVLREEAETTWGAAAQRGRLGEEEETSADYELRTAPQLAPVRRTRAGAALHLGAFPDQRGKQSGRRSTPRRRSQRELLPPLGSSESSTRPQYPASARPQER